MTFANRNQAGSGVYARSLLGSLRDRSDVITWTVQGPMRSSLVGTMRWLTRGGHKAIAEKPPDVLHCPSFVAPWAVSVPLIVTVHDAAVNRYPSDHPLEWRVYTRALMPPRLRAAARVITGSEFARRELIEVYKLEANRVVTIPYGLDPRYLSFHSDTPSPTSPPVMLFPGAPIGRKNLDVVLRSMAAAREGSALAGAHLHISGAEEKDFDAYSRLIHSLGLQARVRWLGSVPYTDMPALFAGVSVLVYPSLYEGFGFPPLEAMAVGTPVVASNRGSLPEILGDAALLVDPADPTAFADALEAALTNPALRGELRAKGLQRAQQFTWEECAAKTVELYQEVLADSKR